MNTSAARKIDYLADIVDLKLGEDEYKTMAISVLLDEELEYEGGPPKDTITTAQRPNDITMEASHFHERQLKWSPIME